MSKPKMMDIGSKMSFNNRRGGEYSLESIKEAPAYSDKVVKIDIDKLELAPDEWNFYPPLDDEEFEKLINSILEHGLLHPIVVWKNEDKYIILSGHNRVRAYKTIAEEINKIKGGQEGRYFSLETGDVNSKEYDQIMAVIKEDIGDNEAQEIIIDANYVQRQLNQKLITKSVIEKYRLIKEKRKSKAEKTYGTIKTREVVARDFNLSGRHIDRYRRLERLNEDLLELFYEGRISLELASKIAGMGANIQNHIAINYMEDLPRYSKKLTKELRGDLSIKEINEIFHQTVPPQNQIIMNIRQDGKALRVVIDDDKIIDKILKLI